jgi:quercetin dioxygenase-like cupin family protein
MLRTLFLFALFAFSVSAVALENSSGVKVTPLLKTTTSWDGAQLKYPEGQAEITGLIVEIAPGAETNWHLHPVPSFGVLMEGELDVHLKDGKVKRIKAGEALAEVVNTLHNGKSVGKVPAKIMVFYAGSVGSTLTVKDPQTETQAK